MTPTDLVLEAVAAIFTNFDASAAEKLLAPDYIQHNPGVPTGAAPILGFIPALKESGLEVTTHRVIAEGNLVVLHNTYENAQLFGGDTLVGFDVFRVEDGKVAEHWDNLQPPADPNPSGRTMTDGATETYYQHNPGIADGLDGLGAALGAMAENGITMVYDEVHFVVAEGNFVFTASGGSLGGAPTAFYDLFRIEDGKIVEHWDTISEVPTEMAHENGKF